jgi:hypothetical protein
MFGDEIQEQAFCVKGGLLWFHHILIAAVEVSKSSQVGSIMLKYPVNLTDCDLSAAHVL